METPKGKKGDELTSEQRLEIRDEVERRFNVPPASFLERIENEVEKRVEQREKFFEQREKLYWIFGGVIMALIAGFVGFKLAEIPKIVEEKLAVEKVIEAKDKIMAIKSAIEKTNLYVNSISESMNTNQQWFMERLNQIKQQDNVVLVNDLSKLFVVQAVTNLVDGNKIILDCEPIPDTVRWTFPQAQLYYDVKMFGDLEDKMVTLNSEGKRQIPNLTTNGLKILYIRKSLR